MLSLLPGRDETGGRFFRPGLLLQPSIDHEADGPEQQVRHAHHQVDAVVVGLGLLERVVLVRQVLRTGGRDGFLSGRAGVGRSRRGEQHEKGEQP